MHSQQRRTWSWLVALIVVTIMVFLVVIATLPKRESEEHAGILNRCIATMLVRFGFQSAWTDSVLSPRTTFRVMEIDSVAVEFDDDVIYLPNPPNVD